MSYQASSTSAFTAIAELKDVKSPHITVDKYEATRYDSPNLNKEYLSGWKDSGEVDYEVNYLTASMVLFRSLLGVSLPWKLTYADTHTDAFTGFIDDMAGDNPNKGVCDIKIKIKVTSLPVYT